MTRIRRNRGVALIVVLWISAVLTLLLYAFLMQSQVEYSLSSANSQERTAEQLALSGIDRGIAILLADSATHQTLNDPWSNSDTDFYEYALGDGVFTLIHPVCDDQKMRWGMEDEAAKLNINVATKEMLMKLPDMTDTISDAILDWRSSGENPRPNGAKSSYYQTIQPPYSCKDAPFETIEELLYVKGVTPQILYGEDTNLNGILDPNENDADKTPPIWDNADGKLDYGFFRFVTVYSSEKNVRGDGKARLNINTATTQQLKTELGDILDSATRNRILQYHLNPQHPLYLSIAHLLDVQGVTEAKFKQIADRVTIFPSNQSTIPGLINVNTAPKQVLMCLPNINEDFANALIAYRSQQNVDLSTIGWLLDVPFDDAAKKTQLKNIANYITTRSYQFRIDSSGRIGGSLSGVVGASDADPKPFPFKRFVAIYDKGAKRLLYFKDISSHGFPYDPWNKPPSP